MCGLAAAWPLCSGSDGCSSETKSASSRISNRLPSPCPPTAHAHARAHERARTHTRASTHVHARMQIALLEASVGVAATELQHASVEHASCNTRQALVRRSCECNEQVHQHARVCIPRQARAEHSGSPKPHRHRHRGINLHGGARVSHCDMAIPRRHGRIWPTPHRMHFDPCLPISERCMGGARLRRRHCANRG